MIDPARPLYGRRLPGAALRGLALGFCLALLASQAGATSGASRFSVLCDGLADCAALGSPLVPASHTPAGSALDFVLGLRIDVGGIDLELHSGGDVYLLGLGNLHVDGSIRLEAEHIDFLGDVRIQAERVELWSGRRDGLDGDGSVRLVADLELDTVARIDAPLVCACLTALAGDLRLEAAAGIAALAGSDAFDGSPPGLGFGRDGDVFLDLSGVSLAGLSVKAAGHMVLHGDTSTPVPEPGSALLLALGLGGLAMRRSRARVVTHGETCRRASARD